MNRQATWTVVALGGVAAVAAVALVAWWPSSDGSSAPEARDSSSTTNVTNVTNVINGSTTWGGDGVDPLASPPATSTDHGELVAVGMQSGTRYAFRLRVDATGITKCTEPSPWPDHPDCLNNGSSELPVLAVFGPPERQWVWSTLPTHQAAHPQLWIHHLDGTLTVVPLEAHGRLAWPAAAALLRGDERSAELRDGTTVLNSLYLHRSSAPTTTTTTTTSTTTPDLPSPFVAVLLSGNVGTGYYELDADTSTHGQIELCLGDLTAKACEVVEVPSEARLVTLSDPHGRGLTVVVAVAPAQFAGIAQLWIRTASGVVDTDALQSLGDADVAIVARLLVSPHGEVELRIGPAVAAILGAAS
jgi:hypothetical protein